MTDAGPALVVAVVTHEKRVLLVQRRGPDGSPMWQLPVAEIGDGETPFDAAARLVAADTGLAVQADVRIGERPHPANGRPMVYVGCGTGDAEARTVGADVLAVDWADRAAFNALFPKGLFPPVVSYLDERIG